MTLFVIVVAAVLIWVFVGYLEPPSVVCGGVVWGLGGWGLGSCRGVCVGWPVGWVALAIVEYVEV